MLIFSVILSNLAEKVTFLSNSFLDTETLQKNIQDQHQQNQNERVKLMRQVTNEMNKLRENINDLDAQSTNTKTNVDNCQIACDHLQSLFSRAQDRNQAFRVELDALRRSKLETKIYEKKNEQMENDLKIIKVVLENTLNQCKSIENMIVK